MKKIDEFLSDSQFGFRSERGTRDATETLRQIYRKKAGSWKNTCICYIDFEKAFDREDWKKLFMAMKEVDIDWKDRRLIEGLYLSQTSMIKFNGDLSDSAIKRQDVRQGCLISPILFTLYVEKMMVEAFEDCDLGIRVGGNRTRDIN